MTRNFFISLSSIIKLTNCIVITYTEKYKEGPMKKTIVVILSLLMLVACEDDMKNKNEPSDPVVLVDQGEPSDTLVQEDYLEIYNQLIEEEKYHEAREYVLMTNEGGVYTFDDKILNLVTEVPEMPLIVLPRKPYNDRIEVSYYTTPLKVYYKIQDKTRLYYKPFELGIGVYDLEAYTESKYGVKSDTLRTSLEVTKFDPKSLAVDPAINPPSLTMQTYYQINTELELYYFIKYDNDYVLYVNGDLYEGDVLLVSEDLELEVFGIKNGKRSESFYRNIEVVERATQDYRKVFTNETLDYDKKEIVLKEDLEAADQIGIFFSLNKFGNYQHVRIDENDFYFEIGSYREDIIKIKGDGNIKDSILDLGYIEVPELNDRGYYITEKGWGESPPYVRLYHEGTRTMTFIPCSFDELSFSDDFKSVFYYDSGYTQKEGIFKRKLMRLSDVGFQKIYLEDTIGYNIKNIQWTSSDILNYTWLETNNNDWLDINQKYLEVDVSISLNDQSERSNSDSLKLSYKKALHELDEEIIIYEEVSNIPEEITSIKSKDIDRIDFINTLAYIDESLVIWFEVVVNDQIIGYTYRKPNDDEELIATDLIGYTYIDDEYVEYDYGFKFLSDKNGEIYVAVSGTYGDLRVDQRVVDGFYCMDKTDEWYGKYLLISKIDGDWYEVSSKPNLNSAGQFFFTRYEYDDYIRIYTPVNGHINEICKIKISSGSIETIRWISDYQLEIKLTNGEQSIFLYENGQFSCDTFDEYESLVHQVTVNIEEIDVKAQPLVDSETVYTYKKDEILQVLDMKKDNQGSWWYKVDQEYWVMSKSCLDTK